MMGMSLKDLAIKGLKFFHFPTCLGVYFAGWFNRATHSRSVIPLGFLIVICKKRGALDKVIRVFIFHLEIEKRAVAAAVICLHLKAKRRIVASYCKLNIRKYHITSASKKRKRECQTISL